MNTNNLSRIVKLFAVPVLLMVLGLVLILNPDSASALIARVLGWVLVGFGAVGALTGMLVDRPRPLGKLVRSGCSILVGVYLLSHPLSLAAWLGRVLGLVLAIHGVGEILENWQLRRGEALRCPSMVLAVITTLAGIVLVALPMTTSRLLFIICGVDLLALGAAEFWERLRPRRRISGSGKSTVIDADE